MSDELFKYYVVFTYQTGFRLAAGYFFSHKDIETPNDIEQLRVDAMNTLNAGMTDFSPASIVILDWKRLQ